MRTTPLACVLKGVHAFEQLYRDHLEFIWRTVRRLGVGDADVEDATQEVFVVAHRKWRAFEHRCTVKTWLFSIGLRVAADYRKRRRRRPEVLTEAPDAGFAESDVDLRIAQRQARQKLDRMLDQLTDEQRAVFVLFELEELPMCEVAAMTGVPLQTAYSRLYAARRIINAQVSSRVEQPSGLTLAAAV